MSGATVHVVSHTHWDREWYRSAAAFRAQLADLADAVADQLETGRLAHFLLDGQTIALADVLAVRPDLESRLAALIRSGKLSVGPWHVLADMTLVSGEALIRNLLRGRRWGRRLGGLMSVGYCPDMFGHPPDLPAILRGFGITTAVVWRGAPEQPERFRWRAPDGSEVLAVRSRYYEPEVLWDEAEAASRFRAWLADRRTADPDGPWLLLNGGDHLAPRDLDGRLAALDVGADVHESTLPAYLAAVEDHGEWPVVTGELRQAGRNGAFLLAGSLSARMELKQANATAQTLLERWAEPCAVWASAATAVDDAGQADGRSRPETVAAVLDDAWDLLLANQPHDSICGCGTDEVHRACAVRSAAVLDLGEHVVERCLRRAGLATRLPVDPPAEAVDLAVLNSHGARLTGPVERELVVAPGRAPIAVSDPDGRPVPFSAEDLGARTGFDSDVGVLPHWPEHRAWLVRLVAHDVPPCGWAAYRVTLGDQLPVHAREHHDAAATVEVDGWRVTAGADATLTLDTPAGRWPGLCRLVDGGDAGDTYTHEPPDDDRTVTARLVGVHRALSAVAGALHLDAVLDLPEGLTADRRARGGATRPVPVAVTVRRWRGVPWVEWTVRADPGVRDHRLRMHVPTAVTVRAWSTDAAFSAVERPVGDPTRPLPDGPGGEAQVGTAPLQTWCAAGGLAVLASGLPEAEAVPGPEGTELALTLLRAVGWLGRHDLRHRTMGAGPPIPVPGAQGPGPREWRWAIRPEEGGTAARAMAAEAWRAPLRAVQLTAPPPDSRRSHLVLAPPALLSAVKTAEDGDGAVVRVRNPTATPIGTSLSTPGWAVVAELDLGERTLSSSAAADRIDLRLGPWATRTFRLRPRRR